jgi:integrase/recombinase XerC
VCDEAIIRVLYNTGARLSEVAGLGLEDLDLDTVRFHGKGAKDRRVRIGPKTARELSRYLRVRGSHKGFGVQRDPAHRQGPCCAARVPARAA